ncbi:sensor histidine kinase [Cellulosimicrobium sp. NPDC057862]|uniref:sensor histidine kinase n=1 Tax=Cellulosimicrobium sp. NPDC057862 TaxID=3346266 RepID=UPI0036722608
MVRDGDRAERRAVALIAMAGVVLIAAVPAVELVLWAIEDFGPVAPDGEPMLAGAELDRVAQVALALVLAVAAASGLAAAVLVRLHVLAWPLRRQVALVLGMSLGIGAVRAGALYLTLPRGAPGQFVAAQVALGTLEACFAISVALYYVGARRRIRAEERRRLEETYRAERARAEAEEEELRVRRDVSRQLHGGLQQRLVLAIHEVDAIRDELELGGQERAAHSLEAVSERLDRLRESEVRAVAHSLYPLAGDFSLSTALLLLADRLPPSVHMDVRFEGVADAVLAGYSLPPADRVLLFSIVEEGVNNAMLHGRADAISVVLRGEPLTERRSLAHVVVDDDGAGLSAEPRLSGVAHLQARVRARGGDLVLGPSARGGARLAGRIPVLSPAAEAEERS